MDTQKITTLVNASYEVRKALDASLADIDRKALNALVLVKRHGGRLAGYGVVAVAFRENATELKHLSERLRGQIVPLVEGYLQALRDHYYIDAFETFSAESKGTLECCQNLTQTIADWKTAILADGKQCDGAMDKLLRTVEQIRAGIDEQQYVVINGRIESALSEGTGAPLSQVSRDMGISVEKISNAIRKYEQQLGQLGDFHS